MHTIFAPITSYSSSISIIRISGIRALECLKKFGIKKNLNANEIKLCNIYNPDTKELLDFSLISYFKAPNSFTGEDIVEINLHGSVYITKVVLSILSSIEGYRIAEPGEFSKRAFLNKKIDLVQAEAINDIVKSETFLQHKIALGQLRGDLSDIYEEWRGQLIYIMALIESFIDFPDEDIPSNIIHDVNKGVADLKNKIKSHINDNNVGIKIKNGLSLAIIGPANVGKSSLLNYLAKSDVAIVCDEAGTTRDVIEVHLDIAGFPVRIADTAGIRNTDNKIEAEGIRRAIDKAKLADLKIYLFDNNNYNFNHELIDEDTIKILNKIDLVDNLEKNLEKNNYDLAISIKEGINLNLLIKLLENKIKDKMPNFNQSLITHQRYKESLILALKNIENFSLKNNIEIAAEDLRQASYQISRITGKIGVDEILDIVFSKFCIGK